MTVFIKFSQLLTLSGSYCFRVFLFFLKEQRKIKTDEWNQINLRGSRKMLNSESGSFRSSHPVNLHIQSEYRKIRTRKNSVFGHFSRSVERSEYVSILAMSWNNWKLLYWYVILHKSIFQPRGKIFFFGSTPSRRKINLNKVKWNFNCERWPHQPPGIFPIMICSYIYYIWTVARKDKKILFKYQISMLHLW